MTHRLEVRVAVQMRDVVFSPREVVVDAQHIVALREQGLAEMRSKEAGAARDEDSLAGECHA